MHHSGILGTPGGTDPWTRADLLAHARRPGPPTRTLVDVSQQPQAFIRGRYDAILILLLWCLRSASLLLMVLGWILLAVNRRLSEDIASEIDSPGEIVGSFTTPLAGVALAIVVRSAAAGLAWLSAAPLVTLQDSPLVPPVGQSRWRRLTDHWRQISAAASVRGTWSVRAAAVAEAGVWGPRLRRTDTTLRWLAGLSVPAFIVVIALVN